MLSLSINMKLGGPTPSDEFVLGSLAIILISLVLSVLVGFPLFGTLVRFRANYVPKRVQLEVEEGEIVLDTPVNSYFGILRRIARIEVRKFEAMGGRLLQDIGLCWAIQGDLADHS
jgi:hypothetical protein